MPEYVWRVWTTTTAATSTNVIDTWPMWNTTAAYSTTITTDAAWGAWQVRGRYEQRRAAQPAQYPSPVVGAAERAETILREHLTPAQRRSLDERGWFRVESEQGNLYRIERGMSGNVKAIDRRGRATARFCIHPTDGSPSPDVMLAQKLLLETDEAAFLRIANRSAA